MRTKKSQPHQCPRCKYSTVGLMPDDISSVTCPECGEYFNPFDPNPTHTNHNAPNKKVITLLYLLMGLLCIAGAIFFFRMIYSISESVS